MRKKGFTLTELLGVIVVLGILALLSFPPTINQIKRSKEGISEATSSLIYNAADLYIKDDPDTYPMKKDHVYCVTLQTLVDEHLLFEPLEDASTGKEIELTRVVEIRIGEDGKITEHNIVKSGNCTEVK